MEPTYVTGKPKLWLRLESKIALAIGIIWLGHIGLDRFFGYGLKYDSSFKHTHIGDLNKPKK